MHIFCDKKEMVHLIDYIIKNAITAGESVVHPNAILLRNVFDLFNFL